MINYETYCKIKDCHERQQLTSALLDRLLHHAETVLIEGKSFRMKDQIDG